MGNICNKCKGHINGCPYEDGDMTMCDCFKANVEYGMISETDEIEVWYEPINDEIDGFVIRNKDEEHSIVKTYIPFDDDREIKVVHESTDVTTDTGTAQKFGAWQLG